MTTSTPLRRVLVLAHTGRPQAVSAATELLHRMSEAGICPVVLASEAADIPHELELVTVEHPDEVVDDVELVVVLGGDGTILRASEVVRGRDVALLGVNLGHVGFLAEIEREDIAGTVGRIAARDYEVEERMTLDVVVSVGHDGDRTEIERTFAVNEATVEKASRERMLEVVTEVDGRPVSTIGCDGVVMATPTGSTAYAFSAGGPVVWPEVEALLMVPISAHALFSRPLVVAPTSVLAVEVVDRAASGVLWCDGRRTLELPPGARIEVRRGSEPLRLARLNTGPFTDRLVAKFQLPVTGWRGPVDA